MNPLDWKREHQVAAIVGIGTGALIGLVIGLYTMPSYDGFRWGELWCQPSWNCSYLLTGLRLRVIAWIMLGGAIGGALIYIRQLLRI